MIKNLDYNSLLMYISLILAIAILFSILFGCSYRKENYREYFEDKKTEEEKTPAKTQPPTVANSKQADPDANLNDAEKKLKRDIKGGKVDEKQLQTFIDNNTITTKNLENIIQSFQQELFSNRNQ